MNRMKDKVALVTGASGWLGSHMAKLFAKEGAKVVVVSRNLERLTPVVNEIRTAGGNAEPFVADVTVEEQVQAMIDFAVQKFGRIDVLVNNAVAGSSGDRGVLDTSNEVWDQKLKVNLYASVWGCKYAIPVMTKNGGGSIINMASMDYAFGDYERVAYCAAKAAVVSLTQNVATTYGKQNIRCNAISPGFCVGPEHTKYLSEEAINVHLQHSMVPRLGTGMDIGHLAVFLGSDESGYITGLTVPCDGGLGMHLATVPQLRALGEAGSLLAPQYSQMHKPSGN